MLSFAAVSIWRRFVKILNSFLGVLLQFRVVIVKCMAIGLIGTLIIDHGFPNFGPHDFLVGDTE